MRPMPAPRPPAALLAVLAMLALAGCTASVTPSPPAASRQAHDPQLERIKAALGDTFGMTFSAAGPHHELGTAPDGVQLDLVGVPAEELVLSVPRHDPALGIGYLPHLRDLLHGPARLYDWAAEALQCHVDGSDRCPTQRDQGGLTARLNDGGEDYLVLVLARR
jgi:hypothetical protein